MDGGGRYGWWMEEGLDSTKVTEEGMDGGWRKVWIVDGGGRYGWWMEEGLDSTKVTEEGMDGGGRYGWWWKVWMVQR